MDAMDTNTTAVRPALWEKSVAWIVLVLLAAHIGFLLHFIFSNLSEVSGWVASGYLEWFLFVPPVVALIGAVLLVQMNRWCLPVFAFHLVLSFVYVWYKFGLANLHWSVPAGYVLEIALLIFCVHLRSKGVFVRTDGLYYFITTAPSRLYKLILILRSRQ